MHSSSASSSGKGGAKGPAPKSDSPMQPSRETSARGHQRYGGSPHGGGRGGKSSTPVHASSSSSGGSESPSQLAKGVYKNKNVHYALSALIGVNVLIQTQNEKSYEGVLTTWSPTMEVVLEQVHEVQSGAVVIDPEKVKDKMFFPFANIVKMDAKEVDLTYASKNADSFMTDAQISAKANGESQPKALQAWQPDDDSTFVELESSTNGWAAEDMFKTNERDHGVRTTFKDNLEGYTVQLSSEEGGKKSKEFLENERRAASIAREIEGNTDSMNMVEMENGDEEEAFSAVQRNPSGRPTGMVDGSSKYVPPAKRQNSKGDKDAPPKGAQRGMHPGGPPPRTTPPPSGGGYRDHDDYGRGGGPGRDGRRSYEGNEGRRSSGGGPGYGQQRGGYESHHRGGKPPQTKDAPPVGMQAQQQQGRVNTPRGPPPSGGKNEKIQELKEFNKNFVLQGTEEESGKKPIPIASAAMPQGSPSYERQESAEEASPAPVVTAAPPPSTAPVVSTAPSTPSATTAGTSAATGPAAAPPVASVVSKSKLNPNAKEFSFNPNARAFVPGARPTGNTPPARPQTPATPTSALPIGPMGAQQPVYQPGVPTPLPTMAPGSQQNQYIPPGLSPAQVAQMHQTVQQSQQLQQLHQQQLQQQQQYHQQQQQQPPHHQPRFRGNIRSNEMPSPLQVQGQPIITSAAIHQNQQLQAQTQSYLLHQQQQHQQQQQQQQQQPQTPGAPLMMRMLPPQGHASGAPPNISAMAGASALQQQQQQPFLNQPPGTAVLPPPAAGATDASGTASGPPSMTWPPGVPPPTAGAGGHVPPTPTPPAAGANGGPPTQAPPPTMAPTPSPGPNHGAVLSYHLQPGQQPGFPHHIVVSGASGGGPTSLPPQWQAQAQVQYSQQAGMMFMNPYHPAAMAGMAGGQPNQYIQPQGHPPHPSAPNAAQMQQAAAFAAAAAQQQQQYAGHPHAMMPQPSTAVPPPHPGQPAPPQSQPPGAQQPPAGGGAAVPQ